MALHHPNKDISAAIHEAIACGWRYTLSGGHAHGILWCPCESREGCHYSVWSTPRSPKQHARWLLRKIHECPHGEQT